MSAARTRRPAALPPAAPALLVPLDVQVLVFADDSADRAWSWGRPKYNNLEVQGPADPRPFNETDPQVRGRPGFRGAIVHWSLPDALTYGHQVGGGPVRYPAAPNRWLVARKAPAGAAWRLRGWIVASDVSPSPTGGSPWPTPDGKETWIGASWPIEQWPGEAWLRAAGAGTSADQRPLTAVGAADPAFAAFLPNVNDVFSYADDLTDLAAWGDVGPLEYTVLGWYADPKADPLLGVVDYGPEGWQTEEQWRSVVAGLGLTVGDEAATLRAEQAARKWAEAHGREVDQRARTRFPARTLCHGLIQGVPWNGPTGPTKSGVPTVNAQLPDYKRPRVAVAHSAVDALAAAYAQQRLDDHVDPQKVAQLADVFSAFAADLLPILDQPDALPRLAIALQQDWFSAADGGTAWSVVGARNTEVPRGDPADPPLTDYQRTLLDSLNDAQRRADELIRTVESEQQALYGLWWKGARLQHEVPPYTKYKEQVAEAFAALEARLADELEQLRIVRGLRDAAEQELRGTLDPEVAELFHSTLPAFHSPADPVLLVSGVRRGLRHGADGRLREDDTLACRFTGQTVSGIAVAVPDGYAPVSSHDVPPPHWRPEELPPEAPDLLAEAFFLDVDDAPWIARIAADKAGLDDPWSLLCTIRTEQTVVWNGALHRVLDPAALEDGSVFLFGYGLGALPQPVAVVFYSPPWSPLYLDWQVRFFPGDARPRAALEPWVLPPDGPRDLPLDAFTYRWRCDEPPDPAGGITLSGRSVLTAQATDLITARLEKLLADFPDAPEVRDNYAELADALAYAQSADLLSQAANGLNSAMLELSPAAFITPADGSLDPYLHPDGGPDTVPEATPNPSGAILGPRFNPIRAGHLQLAKLWVVDDFGQVFKAVDEAGALPPTFPPALPADLVTPGADTLAALKPRITQAVRLALDLLPVAEPRPPGGEPAPAGDGNPVRGWLMHQRLDRALLVHTGDGAYQGAVIQGTDRALWSPNPEMWRPADGRPAPDTIPDPYLRALIVGLLDRPDGRTALRSLLALIDEAAWSVEPREGFVEELPLLTGRPLAVVRARLRLAPRGVAATDQDWQWSGKDMTDGFDEVPFPVQLGTTELLDDGLVGYYLDDDYRRIDTVHAVPDDDYVGHQRPHATLDGSIAPVITLLMDPTAAVHAISGVLPVVRVELPPRFAVPALRRLAVTFRVGPLVGVAGSAAVPVPEVAKGAWSWLEYPTPDQLAVAAVPGAAQAVADLSDAYPVVREGWLRLDPDRTDRALTYAVSPTALPTADDPGGASAASLRFTVHNDTGAAVACTQVAITLPVGPGTDDLTADAAPLVLSAEPAAGWEFSHETAGRLVARPTSGTFVMAAGAGVLFEAAGIRVGGAPGRVALEIAVTTADAAAETADATQSAILRIEKAPARPTTALTYTAQPRTVAAGNTVRLRITCFNGTGAAVSCDRVQLALPVGTGAADLTTRPDRVTATVETPGWSAAADGLGGFVLTPPPAEISAPIAPGAAIEVELAGIEVVAESGFAVLAVAETTGTAVSTATPVVRRTSVGVEKRAPVRGEPHMATEPDVYPPALFTYQVTPTVVPRSTPSVPSTVDLMFSVTNSTGHDVEVDQIIFDLRLGTGRDDLTTSDELSPEPVVGPDWDATDFLGGRVRAAPRSTAQFKGLRAGESVGFEVPDVVVNLEEGLANLIIWEFSDEQRQSLVSVEKTPPGLAIVSFQAAPVQLDPQHPDSLLRWRVTDADLVTLSHDGATVIVDSEGSEEVTPKVTTLYTLTATGGGRSLHEQLTVYVPQVALVSFGADPSLIARGKSSVLRWSLVNAAKAVIMASGDEPDPGPVDQREGRFQVTPHQRATTYTLTASGFGNEVSGVAQVDLVPTVDLFSITPERAPENRGLPLDLRWKVRDVETVSISGLEDPRQPAEGSATVRPDQTTSYTLSAKRLTPRTVRAQLTGQLLMFKITTSGASADWNGNGDRAYLVTGPIEHEVDPSSFIYIGYWPSRLDMISTRADWTDYVEFKIAVGHVITVTATGEYGLNAVGAPVRIDWQGLYGTIVVRNGLTEHRWTTANGSESFIVQPTSGGICWDLTAPGIAYWRVFNGSPWHSAEAAREAGAPADPELRHPD